MSHLPHQYEVVRHVRWWISSQVNGLGIIFKISAIHFRIEEVGMWVKPI